MNRPRQYTAPTAANHRTQRSKRAAGLIPAVRRDKPGGSLLPNQDAIPDAFSKAWEPSEKPFMTVILMFDDLNGKTRYTARVRHWTIADREAHEKMGFHEGWGTVASQLQEFARTLGVNA